MKKIYKLCLLVAGLLSSVGAFAQFAESGTVTKVENGVYYVLYETSEQKVTNNTGTKTWDYTLSGPGAILTVESWSSGWFISGPKSTKIGVAQGTNNSFGDATKQNISKTRKTYTFEKLNHTDTQIRMSLEGTLNQHYDNLKVTMAQYLEGAPATLEIPKNNVGVDNSDSFDFKWCNLGDITITSSNPSLFKVSVASVPATQGKWGKTSVTVTCTHNVEGAHEGTITISGGGKTQIVTVTSSTVKNKATITWNIPENVAIDEVIPEAASIGKAPVTLTLTSSDESILQVEGTTVTAVGVGSAELTATITETANYYGVTETRKINVADKERQVITWDQNLTVIPTTTATIELDASTNSGLPLTYTSSNPDVATISGNILTIVGTGNTDIKVSAEGNDTYFSAYMTKGMTVYDPAFACPDAFICDGDEFQISIGSVDEGKSNDIFLQGKEPATLSFSATSGKQTFFDPSNKTEITISQKIDGSWHEIQKVSVTNKEASTFSSIPLDRRATDVRFSVAWNEAGTTVDFSNVEVKQLRYLETETKSIAFNPLNLGAIDKKEITLNYSALASMCGVYMQKGKVFSVAEGITFGEGCGSVGTKTFTLTFSSQGLTAAECATYEDTILIINSQGKEELRIPVSGTVEQLRQSITWTPAATTLRTIDKVTNLPTLTSANLPISYSTSDAEIAYVNEDNELVILKHGSVTITANAEGNNVYQAAPAVAHIFTINPTPYNVTVDAVAAIEYGTTLSDITLSGSATDEADNAVEGVLTWVDATIVPTVGTADYDVVFTPTNTNYYAATTHKVSITVNKLAQTITWEQTFEDIKTIDKLILSATSSANLPVMFEVISGKEVVSLGADNSLEIITDGDVIITAKAEGNEVYEAAQPVEKTISIRPTKYDLSPGFNIPPTLLLGQALSTIDLPVDATDEVGNTVEGTLAFDNPDSIPTEVGTFYFTATFTPDNPLYDVQSGPIPVEVHRNIATRIEAVETEQNKARKIMRDGVLYIVRDEEVYTITGVRVM